MRGYFGQIPLKCLRLITDALCISLLLKPTLNLWVVLIYIVNAFYEMKLSLSPEHSRMDFFPKKMLGPHYQRAHLVPAKAGHVVWGGTWGKLLKTDEVIALKTVREFLDHIWLCCQYKAPGQPHPSAHSSDVQRQIYTLSSRLGWQRSAAP